MNHGLHGVSEGPHLVRVHGGVGDHDLRILHSVMGKGREGMIRYGIKGVRERKKEGKRKIMK